MAELNKAGITTTAGVRTSVIQSITAIFPDEGMTLDDAEAVSKAVQVAGEGCQIMFMGENGETVLAISDLSQIKFVRFKFPNSGAKAV